MNDYGGFITGQSGMIYVCGSEFPPKSSEVMLSAHRRRQSLVSGCAFDQFLTPTDKIECRNCSHKILYKRRGRDGKQSTLDLDP